MAIILALDIGTSKVCVLAYDSRKRRVLESQAISNDADIASKYPGGHEQDPDRMASAAIRALRSVTTALGTSARRVVGIGITGQMHGVLLAREHPLRALTPLITWRDQRTLDGENGGSLCRAQSLMHAADARVAGCELRAGYGGATLYWLAAHRRLPQRATALTIADYVAAKLTGTIAMGAGMAASFGLFDLRRKTWNYAAGDRLGIPRAAFPQIKREDRPLGLVSADMAARLRVPAQTPVCLSIGDNQASAIGTVGFRQDTVVMNLGTGGQISVPMVSYCRVPGLETRPMPFGGYLLVGASLCGGWAWAYFGQFMRETAAAMTGVAVPDAEVYRRLNRLAMRAPPGAGGIIADTRFAGTRERPQQRGGILEIACGNLTPANLALAVIEGMVRELAELGSPALTSNIHTIAACGNAVRKNSAIRKVIARIFQRPCHVSRQSEEAALGAARCAARTLRLGMHTPAGA